jgi:hypothetical protein
MAGEARHSWLVPEEEWPCLERLRSKLHAVSKATKGSTIEEWCNARLEPSDLDTAQLVALALPSSLNRPFASGEPVSVIPCGACGRRKHVLQDAPRLVVDIGQEEAPHVLSLGRHNLLAASRTLRRTLEERGLAQDVDFVPIEARPVTNGEAYDLLLPRSKKPIVCAPYGWSESPCDECRRGIARCSFFPVFQRPDPTPTCFTAPPSELMSPIVNRDFFAVLSSFAARAPRPATLAGAVYGWFDTDARLAFLPEEFQGTEP